MNTLIIHPGALGDVLLSLSAVKGLRRSFPEERCVWVGKAEIGDLLCSLGLIDQSISIDSGFLSDLFLPFEQRHEAINKILINTSHLIGWFSDQHSVLSLNLAVYKIPTVIIQSPHDEELLSQHYEDRYLETISHLDLVQAPDSIEQIESPHDYAERTDAHGWDHHKFPNSQKIMMHPGSGSSHKCTSVSFFASIAKRLYQCSKQEREVIIIEGPVDAKNVHDLCAILGSLPYTVIRHQALSTVSKILTSMDLFIGHDSGLTHLAAERGVPSIVLFGPTDPVQWAPRGKHVSVIQGSSCHCHDWTSIQACSPKSCLEISTETVIHQAESWLNGPSTAQRPYQYSPC